jgi:signal transduction histidine kinase
VAHGRAECLVIAAHVAYAISQELALHAERRARIRQQALAESEERLLEREQAARAEAEAMRDQLRRLSQRVVEAQEIERRQIARELHDEVGQALTAVTIILEKLRGRSAGEARGDLAEAQALISDLIARLGELSLDLRPTMLDDLGLLPALHWYVERYAARTGVLVAFQYSGVEGRRFAPDVETAAYRVVQEALTNVARHAAVRQAVVRLWAGEDMLGVRIGDEGTGFDLEGVLRGGSSAGLTGMQERVTLLGGELTVESAPGRGTRVTVELPLGRPRHRGASEA